MAGSSDIRRGRLATFVFCLATLALVQAPAASRAAGPEGALDARAWELVSPAEKNGGEVQAPGSPGAAVLQAGAGGTVAFGSAASFGEAAGAPPVSQYLAARAPGGWSTANLTPPLLSGSYAGGAYQLFSADLSRALLTNGWACRDGVEPCAAANPPLGPGAPPGYRNLYLREGGAYTPLITTANAPWLSAPADEFHPALQGATPDLSHVVLSAESNLYEWGAGTLEQVSTVPEATLAAPVGAISADGSRVYFTAEPAPGERNLYLREAGVTVQVDGAQGGGGAFQAASADGSAAFFTKAGHLYRYDAPSEASTDLTPGGEVQGVLGASADGSHVYYAAAGIFLWNAGATTTVSAMPAAAPSDYPPATATARLSTDGSRLAFLSTAKLTGYENVGKTEVFVYEATAKRLLCASCRSNGTTPSGPSSIPGALAAGEAGPAAYKPRALSADGTRLFFDSADSLLFADSDGRPDVYEWEAQGAGGCAKAAGCIGLISSGRNGEAAFLDASADGADAFFLTAASLLPADPGSLDVYDARAGGGLPEPGPGIPCDGDDCQGPPPAPEDPTPGTALLQAPPNPPVHFAKTHHRHKHHHKRHHSGKGERR